MRAWAFLAVLAMPVIAEAPPKQIVKPFAQCDENVCTMSKADFQMLKDFHAQKFQEMQEANALLEAAQAEITTLRQMLARFAGGCEMKRT